MRSRSHLGYFRRFSVSCRIRSKRDWFRCRLPTAEHWIFALFGVIEASRIVRSPMTVMFTSKVEHSTNRTSVFNSAIRGHVLFSTIWCKTYYGRFAQAVNSSKHHAAGHHGQQIRQASVWLILHKTSRVLLRTAPFKAMRPVCYTLTRQRCAAVEHTVLARFSSNGNLTKKSSAQISVRCKPFLFNHYPGLITCSYILAARSVEKCANVPNKICPVVATEPGGRERQLVNVLPVRYDAFQHVW